MRLLFAILAGLGLSLSFPPADLWPAAFYPLNLSWASHAMRVYGGLSWGPSLLLLLLLSFYLALYLGAFSACWVWLRPASGVGQILLAGSLWVTLEFARSYLLTGFPWAFLAYTQSRNLPLIQ